MSLRFCSLASSSSGNCYLVEDADGTRILVDAGVPLRRMETHLRELGVAPESLQGIFLTHAHRDHVASYLIKQPFATRYGISTYASTGTWKEMIKQGCGNIDHSRCHRLEAGQEVLVGGLRVKALAKQHDAAGALCYEIASEDERLAVVTDLGAVTDELLSALRGCHYFVFEANHDEDMEKRSDRPWSLKRRVLGSYGHLSNDQAAAALASIAHDAYGVWLAHLSEECNLPELACKVVRQGLSKAGIEIDVCSLPAYERTPFFGGKPKCEKLQPVTLWEVAEANW